MPRQFIQTEIRSCGVNGVDFAKQSSGESLSLPLGLHTQKRRWPMTAPRSYGKQWIDEMKTAKDFIGKVVKIPVKNYGRNKKMRPGNGIFKLKKSSAEIVARNVNIINGLIDNK